MKNPTKPVQKVKCPDCGEELNVCTCFMAKIKKTK